MGLGLPQLELKADARMSLRRFCNLTGTAASLRLMQLMQDVPDSSFGMRPLGQHGGQPGAVASSILIKMLMDLWLGNPAAISFPLALVLLHRCHHLDFTGPLTGLFLHCGSLGACSPGV